MTDAKEHKKEDKKEEPKEEKKTEEKPKEEKKEESKEEKTEEKKEETAEEKKTKRRTRKKSAKKAKTPKSKVVVARGKRKESKARARIKEGKGEVRINSLSVKSYSNKYLRSVVMEPLTYMGPEVNEIDISVSVKGGGMMGQAQAARTAIAKALVAYFDKENLKEKFISIDRSLLVEDTRRVESKKYRGPKARARYQKSYR